VIVCVFSVLCRTPISRDRDWYGLTEISGISGGCLSFGRHMVLDHFHHGGPVQTAGTAREESPPIKAGHWGAIHHLETTCSRFNTSTRRRTCLSVGPEGSQQLKILPSLNSKAILQRTAYFFHCANISVDAGISSGAKDFGAAKF
jgi:hypothetical protein